MRSSFFLFLFPYAILNAQSPSKFFSKPPLDYSIFNNWSSTQDAKISNNGKYVWYSLGSLTGSSVVIKSITEGWEKHIANSSTATFSYDSKMAVIKNSKDSLFLCFLGTNEERCIPNIATHELFKNKVGDFLIYIINRNSQKILTIENLHSGEKHSYENVNEYIPCDSGQALLIKSAKSGDTDNNELSLISMKSWTKVLVYEGGKVDNIILGKNGRQIAFVVSKDTVKTIMNYRMGDTVILLKSFLKGNIDSGWQFKSLMRFTQDETRLLLQIDKIKSLNPSSKSVMVDIWHYSDKKLQSDQVGQNLQRGYAFLLSIKTKMLTRIQQEDEKIRFSDNDSLAIISKSFGANEKEWNWNKFSSIKYFLLDTYSGARLPLPINKPLFCRGSKYIYGTSSSTGSRAWSDIIIYDISTKNCRNITDKLAVSEKIKHSSFEHLTYPPIDSQFLFRDKYDLWAMDIRSSDDPVCLTNGYGKRNHIIFDTISCKKTFSSKDTVILKAFDELTKKEGFYRVVLGERKNPEKLSMNPIKIAYSYPQKARDAEIYLIKQEATNSAPNFYLTNDFKLFHKLSDNHPEHNYNWMTSEIINWTSTQGDKYQGVLYKPENFDDKKSYPVIFLYYEEMSQHLYEYQLPSLSTDRINIPWFVSHGYAICTPDISYKTGKTGKSALNAVISCAKFLQNYPWVDKKHMGLQGHSFGGYETNYIVTHSNLFAAAVSASGPADFISGYGATAKDGFSLAFFYEVDQNRIGANLWESPDLYIYNSPIFYAHKVTTPLLMMNNKADGIVPFAQGVEFYSALRRLGKRAWMLQYDNGRHSLDDDNSKESDAMDYTIRMMKFFDHYLKDSACPKWMLYGIDAKNKGMETGYELVKEKDKNGKWLTPLEGGLLTDEEKKKVQALKNRKPITVTLK